jgi:hypothetical protein
LGGVAGQGCGDLGVQRQGRGDEQDCREEAASKSHAVIVKEEFEDLSDSMMKLQKTTSSWGSLNGFRGFGKLNEYAACYPHAAIKSALGYSTHAKVILHELDTIRARSRNSDLYAGGIL